MKALNKKQMVSFGIGDFYGGGSFFIIGALFLIFLTDIVKLTPILAGTVLLVGKVWDAITDPTMGYISDRTRSPFGRRRIYFLVGVIPVCISFCILWLKVDIPIQALRFIYYLFAYVLFSTVFTMVMVPYNSMPAEMTEDYKERSKLIGIRMFFSQVGALTGAILPMTIVKMAHNEAVGYGLMGLVFGLIYGCCFIFVFKGTREKGVPLQSSSKGMWRELGHLLKGFVSTFKNRSLVIQITLFITAFVAMDIFNALLIYMVRDYYKLDGYYQLIIGVVVLCQVLTLFVVTKECSKKGNGITYRRHAALWLIGVAIIGIMGAKVHPGLLLGCAAIIGVGLSGAVMVPYNMLAFVTDADELMTKQRREGTYSGAMTFLRKIAQALALFGVSVGLEAVGYQEGVAPGTGTLIGMKVMFVALPSVLILIGIIASYGDKISPKNHQILMKEIQRLKDGGEKERVEEDVRIVCEAIIGQEYDSLWDRNQAG